MKSHAADKYAMIIMCQCSFIICNKCTTLVCNIDNMGVYACVWAESIWRISVLSSQICYKATLL